MFDKPLEFPTDDYDKPMAVLDLDALLSRLQSIRNACGNLPIVIASPYSTDPMIHRIEVNSDRIQLIASTEFN